MNVGRISSTLIAPFAMHALCIVLPCCAVICSLGFLVDDAFIVARFAATVHHEGRHAFGAFGPVADGVTPLFLPWVLAPVATSVFTSLAWQRVLGALGTAAGLSWLGLCAASAFGPRATAGVLVVAASFPLAVHAGSGLETGLTAGLVAGSLGFFLYNTQTCTRLGAGCLGAAACLRPELAPSIFAAMIPQLHVENAWRLLALALGPQALVMGLRVGVFGRPFPLAVLAKPSDTRHGFLYVAAGVVVTGLWIVAASVALRYAGKNRPRGAVVVWGDGDALDREFTVNRSRAVASAELLALTHMATIAMIGGDWMPYARLLVPVVPCLLVCVAAIDGARGRAFIVMSALCTQVFFGWSHWREATGVAADRFAVIERLAPEIAGLKIVAGLDVGFLGAAFAGPVVDLAGLTLEEVARLPGGHTSKRLPEGFLDAQRVDGLVLWAPGGSVTALGEGALFGRVVETRLARSPAVARAFYEKCRIPWGHGGAELVVFVRRN